MALDHLVVLAASLPQAVAWCEATLGVTPGPGGEHPLMGTHNRLLHIATPQYPRAYLELIAINSEASKVHPICRKRWFDMDDAALQQRVARDGPQLVHWVARVPDVRAACGQLAALGWDRGAVLQASRATPAGELRWHITVRDDGQRLCAGALPTLIQWGDTHPADTLPDSGVTLQGFELLLAPPAAPPASGAPPTDVPAQGSAAALPAALQALDPAGRCIALRPGAAAAADPPTLQVRLLTPHGPVLLRSAG